MSINLFFIKKKTPHNVVILQGYNMLYVNDVFFFIVLHIQIRTIKETVSMIFWEGYDNN